MLKNERIGVVLLQELKLVKKTKENKKIDFSFISVFFFFLLVSVKIGDTRLGSMETGQALVRGLIYARQAKVDCKT